MNTESKVYFVDQKIFDWGYQISQLAQRESMPGLTGAYIMEKWINGHAIFFHNPEGKGIGFVEVHPVGESYIQLANLFIGHEHQPQFSKVDAIKYAVVEAHKAHPNKKVFSIFMHPEELEVIKPLFDLGATHLGDDHMEIFSWEDVIIGDNIGYGLVADLDNVDEKKPV